MIPRILFAVFISMIFVTPNLFAASADSTKISEQAPEKEKKSEATEAEEKVPNSVSNKTITGEVSGVTNENIAVTYKEDVAKGQESDILLPFDESVQLERIKSLKELKTGDSVEVTYSESALIDASGTTLLERKAKIIKFLKAAPIEAPMAEESNPALTSE